MPRIHEDRFKPGDIVTWRDENFATTTNGRKKFGDRITIKETRNVSGSHTNICTVGHYQHVTLWEDPNAGFDFNSSCYSGAFFRHLALWERTS